MSQALDLLNRAHNAQLRVVGKGQDGLLSALDRVLELRGKLPTTRKASGAAGTLTSVIGRPVDFVRFAGRSAGDWGRLSEGFHNKLASAIDAESPSTEGK